MKYEDDLDLGRLASAINRDYTTLKPYREERVRMARHAAGDRYHPNAQDKATYINLTSLYTNIVSRNLISQNPRILLSTNSHNDEPAVSAMEKWDNDQLERMNFAEIMKRFVVDAFYGMATCMVAIATPSDAANCGWNLRAGDPFVKLIYFGDRFFDMSARTLQDVGYSGHRYRAPKRPIVESELYDVRVRGTLASSEPSRYNHDGDEKIEAIGNPDIGDVVEELEDMVDLCNVYVPRHRCVYTLLWDDISGASAGQVGRKMIPLRKQKWIGPEWGPYIDLSLAAQIPGNIVPKGTIQDFMNLEDALNNVYRKLVRQAHDQKNGVLMDRSDADSAEEIRKMLDGGFAFVNNPKNVVATSFNGPNQGLFTFMRELIQRASWVMGNIETMGGLATQAGTLGQEELLAQQSNGQIAGMQDATLSAVSQIVKSLNWFYWHDPVNVATVKDSLEGSDRWITREVHPWTSQKPGVMKRTGPMPQVKVDPYSMRHSTPKQRSDDLIQVVTQIWAPLAQLAREQGNTLDFNQFLTMLGEYRDMPELKKILTMQEPIAPEQGPPSAAGPTKPVETTRNYNRRSQGGSPQSQDAALMSQTADQFSGEMQ